MPVLTVEVEMNTGKFLAALVVAFALGMVLGEVNRRRDQHPNWESRLVAGDEVEVHFPRELVDEPSTLAADGTPTKRPILARSRLFVGSEHTGVFQVGMGDGSVQTLSDQVDLLTLMGLSSRNGKELVTLP